MSSRPRSRSPRTKSKTSRVTRSPSRKSGGKKRSVTSKSKSRSKSKSKSPRSRKPKKSTSRRSGESPSQDSKRTIVKAVHQAEEVERAVERMREKEKKQPGFLKRWYTKLVGKPGSKQKVAVLASSVVTLLGVLALSASYYNPEMGAQIQDLIAQFKNVVGNVMSTPETQPQVPQMSSLPGPMARRIRQAREKEEAKEKRVQIFTPPKPTFQELEKKQWAEAVKQQRKQRGEAAFEHLKKELRR